MSYLSMQTTEMGQAQVTEALLRMKALKLHENVINEFRENGRLNKSENLKMSGFGPILPILYWLDGEEEQMVRNWENETGNIVYHVVKNYTNLGTQYSFLYVSKYPEEWQMDNDDLKAGYPVVYVKNIDIEEFSEYGSIGIELNIGGVRRTA